MKVAIVGQFQWYGTMGEVVANAWEDNGHEVTRIDRFGKIEEGYDLYVFVDCSEDFSSNIPELKAPKIFWSLDCHMPLGTERSVNIARKCDLTFSTNYEYGVKILEKFGIESILLPVTYCDRYVGHQSLANKDEKKYEVVMIGHKNSPQRVELWDMLHENFEAFTGRIEEEDQYRMVMNSACVIVNQPTEPWDIIINNRFFEAMAYGSVLLQKRLQTKIIEKMGFIEGKHFIYWDDFEGLQLLIKNVLIHYKDYDQMRKLALSKVAQFSMNQQCLKMETFVLSNFFNRM